MNFWIIILGRLLLILSFENSFTHGLQFLKNIIPLIFGVIKLLLDLVHFVVDVIVELLVKLVLDVLWQVVIKELVRVLLLAHLVLDREERGHLTHVHQLIEVLLSILCLVHTLHVRCEVTHVPEILETLQVHDIWHIL